MKRIMCDIIQRNFSCCMLLCTMIECVKLGTPLEARQGERSYDGVHSFPNIQGRTYDYWQTISRSRVLQGPNNLRLTNIHKRPRMHSMTNGDGSGSSLSRMASELPYLSVELSWDPPEGLHSIHQVVYQVFVRLIGPPEVLAEITAETSAGDPSTVYKPGHLGADPDSELVDAGETGLHPHLRRQLLANVTGNTFRSSENDGIGYGMTYQFEVALVNGSTGGPAAKLNVTTPDAAPATSPLHIRLSGLSSSSVMVSWAPPPLQYRNGRITGYQVRYFEVGAETQTETLAKVTAPDQRQFIANDLKEKTFYTFMIRALTSAGGGPWSGASNIRTSVELPPPPVDIHASRINQHQIKVTWRTSTGGSSEDQTPMTGSPIRQHAIQGFRLLYSPKEGPQEANQWTSFDVGPINMAIISHLERKTNYVICIKSRGLDGRYGECSQPVISQTSTDNENPDFSVRNVFCISDPTSIRVTWQQPVITKQLEGFKLRVGGAKKYADSTGSIRTLQFPARSVQVAYTPVHAGYTYTVSDLEPNSVYDVQVSAYYEMTVRLESNWETTSCYTQMLPPPALEPPIPVAASSEHLQVIVQLSRASERFGKIRNYYLIVSPVHLTYVKSNEIDIESTITTSRGLSSADTRYVAARYTQDLFEPAPRYARNFTLGKIVSSGRVPRSATGTGRESDDAMSKEEEMQAEVSFDNKPLLLGQEYMSFVRACVFRDDQSTETNSESCTTSKWSVGFGPDRPIQSWQLAYPSGDEFEARHGGNGPEISMSLRKYGIFGLASNRDLLVITVVSVVTGILLLVIISVSLWCISKKRRRCKLGNNLLTVTDLTMKQPLMRFNEFASSQQSATTSGFPGVTVGVPVNSQVPATPTSAAGLDLISSNPMANSHVLVGNEAGGGSTTGGSFRLPSAGPRAPLGMVAPPSLMASMATAPGMVAASATTLGRQTQLFGNCSATSSPMGRSQQSSDNQLQHPYQLHQMNLHPQLYGLQHIPGHQQPLGYSPNGSSEMGPTAGGANALAMKRLMCGDGSQHSSLTGVHAANMLVMSQTGVSDGSPRSTIINGPSDILGTGLDAVLNLSPLAYENKGKAMRHPVPINCLHDHVSRLQAAENLLFSQEYESIETELQATWENSNLEVNKAKNRYANVVAYDHSRVVLQSIKCVPGSDYINANFVDGYRKKNAYIATQGPMPDTFSDFWRMIWEQRVCIIVMMTRLEERSHVKCDKYWPSRGAESYAGGLLTVTPVEVLELAYYTIRTFNLTARGIDDECREVKHFQFTNWPDHGVPESPIPLLLFVRRVRATLTSVGPSGDLQTNSPTVLLDPSPLVVHCSAGVGRTGAFIVIDMMLERIKYEKTVDIYGCVRSLRTQRNFMVQTEDQYMFIHSAVLEAVDAGNTEVPARNLLAHLKKIRQVDANSETGMELEFRKLQQYRVARAKYTTALLSCNKTKNRSASVLPYESSRVALPPIRGVEGSDYVNASFVDGYRLEKAYIATQGPLAKTVEDFWRMVWEFNSNIVVMLTQLNEQGAECCHPYWPIERSARYQYYVVDPMVEYNMPNYTLREFKLTDARDGQSRTLRQFQFMDWPEQSLPSHCEALINFLGQVHKTKEQFGQDGPITVHCSNGAGRTGVFITLSIVLERMRYEGVVDLFQTVRLLRSQRPGMIQTEQQYLLCYSAALQYLSSFDHYAN